MRLYNITLSLQPAEQPVHTAKNQNIKYSTSTVALVRCPTPHQRWAVRLAAMYTETVCDLPVGADG